MPNLGRLEAVNTFNMKEHILFAPHNSRIKQNIDYEKKLKHVSALISELSQGYANASSQGNPNSEQFWLDFNVWLNQNDSKSPNSEPRIGLLFDTVKDLVSSSSSVIELSVFGFNFSHFCNNVLNGLKSLYSLIQTTKNAVAIFVTAVQFMRVAQDLYYYKRLEGDQARSFYKYAYIGTKHMKVTWSYYGRQLFHTFNNISKGSLTKLIATVLYSNRKTVDRPTVKDKTMWLDCVAASDFAYCKNIKNHDSYYPIHAFRMMDTPFEVTNISQFNFGRGLKGAVLFFPDSGPICLAFSGTDSLNHVVSDVIQFCGMADGLYFASLGLAISMDQKYKSKELVITGHSLGGGLTQFVTASLMRSNIQGIGFNSAGMSKRTMSLLDKHQKNLIQSNQAQMADIKIQHVVLKNDPVSKFGCK